MFGHASAVFYIVVAPALYAFDMGGHGFVFITIRLVLAVSLVFIALVIWFVIPIIPATAFISPVAITVALIFIVFASL